MKTYNKLLQELSTMNINQGLQQIYTVGDPNRHVEVRFEQGDTEALITVKDDGGTVSKIWLDKTEVGELLEVLGVAHKVMK